jgi:hypothetical protein
MVFIFLFITTLVCLMSSTGLFSRAEIHSLGLGFVLTYFVLWEAVYPIIKD